jgi:hypothetical protein
VPKIGKKPSKRLKCCELFKFYKRNKIIKYAMAKNDAPAAVFLEF